MTYRITPPRRLKAHIQLPASKSISNRALMIHALSTDSVLPDNLSDCDDTEVMVRALRDMPAEIDIKAAGTAMRFMTAYLCVTPGEYVLTGTERMKQRPIRILVNALRYLGADITYMGEDGFPPLRIRGRQIAGGHLEIPGSVSSQYISALLLIGPVLRDGLTLRMTGEIVSRPYIDLTLCTMREFGARADWTDVDTITVRPSTYIGKPYMIENDWSASSYWYEMMAFTADSEAETLLEGLMDGSRQGDSVVKYIFSLLGVKTQFASTEAGVPTTVKLKCHPSMLPRLDYDFVNSPDLAQTLVVTCCGMGIPFRFTGLASLRIKETDRIAALKRELGKMGFVLTDEGDDVFVWTGERCEPTGEAIDTYEDHRMAMALAPMAIKLGHVDMNHPEVVSKSYPHFWDDLRKAGFTVERL
ncbi:3-phosphoshikimate 1-carboxyvinyltransferase [Prevotella sp.]|uniref:3-phosphoshikimate 1-carboxyvinyltransferase n=1 Tax=Prevotella sp. TaxID=59823 RepID=UPI002F921EC8